MMRICIGLCGCSPGWRLLLEQEGVPYADVHNSFSPEEFSVVILGHITDHRVFEQLQKYQQGGGALLCSGESFYRFSNAPIRESVVRYLLPDSGGPFDGIGMVDLMQKAVLHPQAQMFRTQDNMPAVWEGMVFGGTAIVLPFDAGDVVIRNDSQPKSFYAARTRLPYETVSVVSKQNIRKLVSRSLEILHHRRGLPYVHLWYYPDAVQTIASIRIDTDGGSREQILALEELAASKRIPLTWFLDVKTQQHHFDMYLRMSGHEIAMHCYEHELFQSADQYIRDIERAKNFCSSHGITVSSYAAPYGHWNEDVAKAIETFDFVYSSEFSYDYDNLPSFPLRNERVAKTLQVPVHPISIGSLRRQGFDEKEMKAYFYRTVQEKIASREPMMFYHHPKDMHLDVLASLIDAISQHHVSFTTMESYAVWWNKRIRLNPKILFEGTAISLDENRLQDDVVLRCSRVDGTEAFVPIAQQIDFANVSWKKIPIPSVLPDDIVRIRKFNPWISLHQVENILGRLFR